MKHKSNGFSLDFMAGYYDKLTFTEKSRFRRKQIALIAPREGENVLDVGCGTGILSVLSKMAVGEAKFKLDIDFKSASVTDLPFPDGTFDVVISSLMFHHLPPAAKRGGLQEIIRVLKQGGRFFLSDFGTPHAIMGPLMFLLLIWISSTRYQLFGKLPALITESGFSDIQLVKKGLFLKYYIAKK
jgi:ubiquinone/menaquinone biosynthesis C-methylase UbiE